MRLPRAAHRRLHRADEFADAPATSSLRVRDWLRSTAKSRCQPPPRRRSAPPRAPARASRSRSRRRSAVRSRCADPGPWLSRSAASCACARPVTPVTDDVVEKPTGGTRDQCGCARSAWSAPAGRSGRVPLRAPAAPVRRFFRRQDRPPAPVDSGPRRIGAKPLTSVMQDRVEVAEQHQRDLRLLAQAPRPSPGSPAATRRP